MRTFFLQKSRIGDFYFFILIIICVISMVTEMAPGCPDRRVLNLSTIVVAVLFHAAFSSWALLSFLGVSGAAHSQLALACRFLDGIVSGTAVAAVSHRRIGAHLVWSLIIVWFGITLMVLFLSIFLYNQHMIVEGIASRSESADLTATFRLASGAMGIALVSDLFHDTIWLAGAFLAGKLMPRWLAQDGQPVELSGVGRAFQPIQRPLLAVFFVFSSLPLVMFSLVTLREFTSRGLAIFNQNSAIDKTADFNLLGSIFGIAGLVGGLIGLTAVGIKLSGILSLAKRCFPPSAIDLLSSQRGFSIWIRPFDVDGLPAGLSRKRDLLVGLWKNFLGRSLEQRVARSFRKMAPLIAVGRPGDCLPPQGAARLYSSDEEWHAIVGALIQNSSAVILHAATSDGTLWEWRRAFEIHPRSRLLLCVPIRAGSNYARDMQLYKLRTHIEALVGGILPDKADSRALFAYFESENSKRARWLTRDAIISTRHPLRAVLNELKGVKFSGKTQSIARLAILLVLLLLSLGGLAWFYHARVQRKVSQIEANQHVPSPDLIKRPPTSFSNEAHASVESRRAANGGLQKSTSPKKFWFDYAFQPFPGRRIWTMHDGDSWEEEYENGIVTHFKVVGRTTVDNSVGTVVSRTNSESNSSKASTDDSFQVFIPDLGSPNMRLSLRQKLNGNWQPWRFFTHMKGVE